MKVKTVGNHVQTHIYLYLQVIHREQDIANRNDSYMKNQRSGKRKLKKTCLYKK